MVLSPNGTGSISATKNLEIETAADPRLRIYSDDLLRTSYFDITDSSVTQTSMKKVSAAGSALFNIDPMPLDGVSSAAFIFFRATNTTGITSFDIHRGDGSATRNARLAGSGSSSYVCADNGNFGVGTAAPGAKLDVAGHTRTSTLAIGNESILTIASGVITITNGFHRIDTEASAATDDLDTINGGLTGMILVITAANSSRDIVLKDGTGNLKLEGDCTLDNIEDTITLIYSGASAAWKEIARSNNGA